jgi:hypothetical protein
LDELIGLEIWIRQRVNEIYSLTEVFYLTCASNVSTSFCNFSTSSWVCRSTQALVVLSPNASLIKAVESSCKNFGSLSSCKWKIISFIGYLSPFNHLYSVPQGDSRNLTMWWKVNEFVSFFSSDDKLPMSVFMSQHQQIGSKGGRSWSVKRRHRRIQSIFWMMTFVIFRKSCKMIPQFQKWVNTKFCLYDWASQAHRCTTNLLIHLQVQNLFCLLFLLVTVPKKTITNNIDEFSNPY